MRWQAIVVAAAMLGGCTLARMDGFDTLAARPGTQRIDVTGIPGWMNGDFALGSARGHVRRIATGDWIGWGPRGEAATPDELRDGLVARYGRLEFEIAGAEAGGRIEARCRYIREEARADGGAIVAAAPTRPLRLNCAYRLDGRDAGLLTLGAVPPMRATVAEPRLGSVRFGATELGVRSVHRIAGIAGPSSSPIGYFLDAPGGGTVGAVETNGIGSRRLILPIAPDRRAPALAATLTLALFWDPGDVD